MTHKAVIDLLEGDLTVEHTDDGDLEIKHKISDREKTRLGVEVDPEIDPTTGPGAGFSKRPEDVLGLEEVEELLEEDDFGKKGKRIKRFGKRVGKGIKKSGKLIGTAAKTAGKPAHSLYKHTSKATGVIRKGAGKIPGIGKPLRAAIDVATGPSRFAARVASGKRIDKAALKTLKDQLKAAKTLAPYAQAVSSFVPGVGTGIAASIAASTALMEGRHINEALLEATKASLPGGPAAQAAFDVGVAAAKGKNLRSAAFDAAVDAIPVNNNLKGMIKSAADIAQAAAEGRPVRDEVLRAAVTQLSPHVQDVAKNWIGKAGAQSKIYDQLTKELPTPAKKALATGIALGAAQAEQTALFRGITNPSSIEQLKQLGETTVDKSKVLRATASSVPDQDAFFIGIGIMKHQDVSPKAIEYLRDTFRKSREKLSFDAALATHIGVITSKKQNLTVKGKVGYYSILGSLTASDDQRASMVRVLTKDDAEAQTGAALAIKQVRAARTLLWEFWEWIKKKVMGE